MPTISVIIPIYNTVEFLSTCLSSLLKQTLADVEIICVDDNSSDGSWNILHSFAKKDSRIKVFRQKNAGPGVARNLALSHAKGKYVMFCDSDDWYEPTMCEKMYFCMYSHNVDLVCCNCILEYEGNSFGRDKQTLNYHYLKLNF